MKTRASMDAVLLVTLVSACGPAERPDRGHDRSGVESADSLAFSTPAGLEIWFTLSRPGTGPTGQSCVERGLEIRRGEERIPVPLLYTGEKPTLLNDSTMRAVLWTNCRPVAGYLVNLRTGRPVREHRGSA